MTTAKQLIQELNETDETERLEAKTAANAVGRSVYESICAMSNEPGMGGGIILLGVAKEEMSLFPQYTATGVEDSDKLAADLGSGCASIFNIPVRVGISTENVASKTVIVIRVPELPVTSKPLYFKSQHLPRGAYRRQGTADIRCTDEDLSIFFQSHSGTPFDATLVRETDWDDIDPIAVAAYRAARASTYPDAEALLWTDQELLHALGAIRYVEHEVRLTITGLLVFGKSQALRRLMPSHRVDYIRVPGNIWVSDPEVPFQSTEIRGSILTAITRVMTAVSDDLPKAHRIESNVSAQRTETPVIPLRVLREAIVNAMMHRSYQSNRPVQVVRYANRIEIKNPGYSLKSQERFEESGSFIRNPSIAEILHETRYAETKGSGIRVMRQKMAESGLASPTFQSNREQDEFEAAFLFHHFLDQNDVEWLGNFRGIDLSEDQMKALIFVREVGAISNAIYRSLTHTETLVASKSLRKLRTMDLLSERGNGASRTYVAGPEMLRRLTMDGPDASIHGSETNVDVDERMVQVLFQEMPLGLRNEIKTAQLTRRLSPERAEAIIERMCSWRPLSLSEISAMLRKSGTHVSQKYISSLVSSGRLTYLIPEMPQHPGQKYVAKTKVRTARLRLH